MTVASSTVAGESVDLINDALLTASGLLVAISARSIALVDQSITIPQFQTLVTSSNRRRVSLATLGGVLHLQRSTTGRTVDRLVRGGLIDRRPHPNSRRESTAEPTAPGRQGVQQVTAQRRHEIARGLERTPPRERRGPVRALAVLTAAGGQALAHLDVDS